MILPDVNVLIYAFRADAPHRHICKQWLDEVFVERIPFALSPLALAAVVRITTTARALPNPSSAAEAFAFVDFLASRPECEGRRTRRTALGHFQTPLPRDEHDWATHHRCLVRGVGYRMGLRADHLRS